MHMEIGRRVFSCQEIPYMYRSRTDWVSEVPPLLFLLSVSPHVKVRPVLVQNPRPTPFVSRARSEASIPAHVLGKLVSYTRVPRYLGTPAALLHTLALCG